MAEIERKDEFTPSTGGEEQGGKPKKGRTRLLYAAALPALAALAFALVLFVVKPLFPPPEAGEGVKAASGKIVPLQPVIVNLAGSEGRRYLKARVELEVSADERGVKEIEERKPLLLDLLIETLSRKRFEEVSEAEGREHLRKEILEQFTRELGAGKVRRVFLTEFVVQ